MTKKCQMTFAYKYVYPTKVQRNKEFILILIESNV